MLPYYPMEDNGAFHWEIYSYSNKMIADYCNIPITKVKALPLDEWLMYRRDSLINNSEQSEKGKKYLKNAYQMTQTKPDIKSLKDVFGWKLLLKYIFYMGVFEETIYLFSREYTNT